jgi:sugar phosphate isomerase/epimerase
MRLALNSVGPNVYVCLDIGNALLDPPVTQWIEEFHSRIVKIHLSDGLANAGSLNALLPGHGEVSWNEVRAAIERIQCEIDLFVEAPLPTGTPEVAFLDQLRRAIRTVWE